MRKVGIILSFIIICISSLQASASVNKVDFDANGFQYMKTTAYCTGEITFNGSKVHEGGCASTVDHIGDIALIYTMDGEFLGMFECNDIGSDPILEGYVIDVYWSDYDKCVDWMEKTQGVCMVKYVEGNG